MDHFSSLMEPVSVRFYLSMLVVLVAGGMPVVSSTAQVIEKLPRPDTAHAPSFGVSVALEDSIAVVGASGEEACGENAGAVYVYEREAGPQFDAWRGTARLTPRRCRPNTFFGERVVLSGNRLLVSTSSEEGMGGEVSAAYVFERSPIEGWEQTARFTGASDREEGVFASDIALDGDRAVVSTSGDVNGAYGGAVYVYTYDAADDQWKESDRLTASRGVDAGVLGRSVSLHGRYLAVAASTYFEREAGSVYLFRRRDSGEWEEGPLLRGIEAFFIDLHLDGTTLIVGEDRAGDSSTGRASVFEAGADSSWQTVDRLRPEFPYESGSFGSTVSVEEEWALVTGYGEQLGKEFNIDRVVYVFRRDDDGSWQQHTILDIGRVAFGAALDQSGSTALVSSVPEDGNGTAYVIHLK